VKFYLSKRKNKKEILMGAFDEALKFWWSGIEFVHL
jgi:hypothetical protein